MDDPHAHPQPDEHEPGCGGGQQQQRRPTKTGSCIQTMSSKKIAVQKVDLQKFRESNVFTK